MKFQLGCELNYRVIEPTTLILNVEAQHVPSQTIISERFSITEGVADVHLNPETGNRYRRFLLEPADYKLRYEAEIALAPTIETTDGIEQMSISELPLDVMNHLFPSRYCQSDKLARFAWRQFSSIESGYDKVTAICNWIYDNVDYVAGSSDGSTSAYDTFSLRAGVCRDFAHLGITFCRALGIPARFVSAYGYQLEPQDFHAVFEAYLDGRWYVFDPTRLSPANGIIRIGVGRDAADTAFATFYGKLESSPKTVWVNALDDPDATRAWTTDAVSLSTT